MTGSDIAAVLLAVFLLALNAFFVAVEFALISSRRDRLDSMIATGNARAKIVLAATEQLSIMLAGAQFGITIASLLLGKVGEPAIAHIIEAPFHYFGMPEKLLHPVSFAIALLLVTMLHIVLGEMVPKNVALAGPETVATILVPVHTLFVKVTHPIMLFLNWIARHTLRLFGVEQKDELESSVSPSQLASMIQESRSEGLIAPEEAKRLSNALGSSRRTLKEVLIPTDSVRSITCDADGLPVADIEEAVSETGYSRFPVADSAGTWRGYVHVKDVLDTLPDPDSADAAVATAPAETVPVRPLLTVRQDINFDVAMRNMRRMSAHIAAVVDDEDQIIGMVTLEDIIEELVGTVNDWTHD